MKGSATDAVTCTFGGAVNASGVGTLTLERFIANNRPHGRNMPTAEPDEQDSRTARSCPRLSIREFPWL